MAERCSGLQQCVPLCRPSVNHLPFTPRLPPPACSLEDLLSPELRAEPRLAALDLRRLVLVLPKYRELDKASGLAGMHKSKQAEVGGDGWAGRFVSTRRERWLAS